MAFNIDAFRSNGLIWGGARPTLFEVQCSFPPGVTGANVIQGGRFLIQAATLPPMQQDQIPVPYFGRTIKVAGDRTFDPWRINVMNDEDFALRNAFETWQNEMNTLVSNRLDDRVAGEIASPDSYKVDLVVSQYAKAGPPGESGIIRQYLIIGAFPMQIDEIPVGWNMVNSIENFGVTFAYDFWVPGNSTTPVYPPVLSPE